MTLRAINDELARLGDTARLAMAEDWFSFQFGEAEDWPHRTAPTPITTL